MKTHGTPLDSGQLARFMAAGTKALVLLSSQIGAKQAAHWSRNEEELQRRILEALRDNDDFETWKSINVGGADQQLRAANLVALERNGISIAKGARDLIISPLWSPEPVRRRIDLVRVTMRDLGYEMPVPYGEIVRRANELGLELCPVDAGLELRLAYMNQPLGTRYIVATKGVPNEKLSLTFSLTISPATRKLDVHNISSDVACVMNSWLVFMKPAK